MSQKQIVIVTGAGSGIGRAAALALARAGVTVILVGRTDATLRDTAARIVQQGGEAEPVVEPTDVTDPDAVDQLVDRTLKRFGRIDAVANVAGDAPLGPIGEITPQRWRQCIDTNLSAIVYMTRALWPSFTAQHRGVIINVSSMASVDPFPGFAMYAAAKVGVNMFTKCTADEGRDIGVKALALVLGAVETDMLRGLFSEKIVPKDKTYPPQHIGQLIADCILGKKDFDSGQTLLLPGP